MMGRFLVLAAAALLSACAANGMMTEKANPWATLSGEAPLVIAHRGASGYLPEHTLEAYALAIEQGADVVEPDLVFTKDRVLVARHDRYLSTTTNVADLAQFADRRRVNPDASDDPRDDWWVEDFTLAEIKTLRARQPFEGRSKEFDDQYLIPTFGEVLALVEEKSREAGRPVGVYPETKHPGFYASIGYDFQKPLLIALQGFRAGPVFIQSFEPEILKRLKGKTTAKLVQLVYEETPGAGPNIPLEDIAAYADGVGPPKELLFQKNNKNEYYLDRAHKLNLFVHAWTYRDDVRPLRNAPLGLESLEIPEGRADVRVFVRMHSLPEEQQKPGIALLLAPFAQGVDGVFTDFPDTAVRVRDAMDAE